MRKADSSSPLPVLLLIPVPGWLQRLVGRVAWLFAALLALFAVLMVFLLLAFAWQWATGASNRPAPLTDLLIASSFLALSAALARFLDATGRRLMSGRFNENGSIVTPVAWLVCCLCFLAAALVAGTMAVVRRDLTDAQTSALFALFALFTYGAWAHFRRLRVRVNQTPQ